MEASRKAANKAAKRIGDDIEAHTVLSRIGSILTLFVRIGVGVISLGIVRWDKDHPPFKK